MTVSLARRAGDEFVLERVSDGVVFEGGQAQPGVVVTFVHRGHEVTARVVEVEAGTPGEAAASIVTLEEIDANRQDRESERALDMLTPPNDLFDTDEHGQPTKLPPRHPE